MITVEDLSFGYAGMPSETLHSVDFSIDKGEIFGFLGPSGAGKSTTQKVLIRLLHGYRGSIQILGKDLREWGSDFYNHIGVGFELPNHYSRLTALENLKFFATFYTKPVSDLMKLLGMVGLQEDAHRRTSDFSKGMKMRLNFVRALMHDPGILFLDEPTTGLDPMNARLIKDVILDLKSKGKTIFLTTHNMHDAEELCDRVSFIAGGTIKATDSPRNLKLQNGRKSVIVEYGKGRVLRSEFPLDDLGANESFQSLLRKEHIQSIHSQEAGLDEVFIRITGHSLT